MGAANSIRSTGNIPSALEGRRQAVAGADATSHLQEMLERLRVAEGAGMERLSERPSASAMEATALQAVKQTFQPSKLKRKRKHGYLKRLRSKGGRNIIKRRMMKGRHRLAPPG